MVGEEARRFARALVCQGTEGRPCERCRECLRSSDSEPPVELDGAGKKGPRFRHIGDHPDLYWVDRGPGGTRVRIDQIREAQQALRLGAHEGGYRVLVIADAEWLNQEAQNSLLKLLEEPPDRTTLLLASGSSAPLAATIRSRCQKIRFPETAREALRSDELPEQRRHVLHRFDAIENAGLTQLLDWAEEYRGNRATAAEAVEVLLEVGTSWLGERVRKEIAAGERNVRGKLDAHRALTQCRKDLVQRNANPQMVAERALLAVRKSVA